LNFNHQSPEILEEAARIAYMFSEFKECIEFNKSAMLLKSTPIDQNLSDIGICYYQMEKYGEA